jgi:hypothetical protein
MLDESPQLIDNPAPAGHFVALRAGALAGRRVE